MVTSACQVLDDEPERFIDYVISDPRLRSKIYDEESFGVALEESFKSDPTLKNISDTIKGAGEKIYVCGKKIFDTPEIKRILSQNNRLKKKEIRERVKKQRPRLKGTAFKKEVERRYNIAVAIAKKRPPKQISIEEATKPIRVKYFDTRFNKEIKYRKTKHRTLTKQEKMLITNSIKKKKLASQVIKDYYDSGLAFRSQESIRKHFYRIRRKIK